MTRREAPSSRDSRSATGVPGAAPHSSPSTHLGTLGRVFRASMLGAATLVAMGAGSACLDRPVAPAEPRTSNTFSERVSLTQIDKIDLLFMIDNSASMADKQEILAKAIPDLVGRLVSPDCVQIDATGNVTSRQKNTGTCADGFVVEFNAIKDIHIGVVSSSLGGHGSDSCNPASPAPEGGADDDDRGRLITRSASGGTVATWAGDSGFFQWDPGAKQTPPGDASADQLNTKFTDLVRGAGQTGCGFEASLEAWYRFLIDPSPPETISIFDSKGTTLVPPTITGVDTALLQQRAEFLRPDSLVAVISLSDENDCSTIDGVLPTAVKRFDGTSESDAEGWNLQDNKSFQINYVPNIRAAGGLAFRMKSGTAACAANPSDPACTECFNNPNGDGCKTLSPNEDSLQVRCWDQKRRFGVDTLYPVQRYVDGLREAEVFDLRSVYDPANNAADQGRTAGAARLVPNPLFQDLAYDLYQTLKGQLSRDEIDQQTFDAKTARLGSDISTRGRYASRSADAVFFAAIVGVPWQDIANDPKDLKKGYKLATEVDWSLIRSDGETKAKDPFMQEAISARSGTHPILTDIKLSLTERNEINGHEWNSQNQDLMYACRLPLLPPKDCSKATGNCDCPDADQTAADLAGNPLCQEDVGKPYGQTQYWAKAYPGTRFIEVMNRFQSGSIIASICTPNVDRPAEDDFGYRPAVNAIIDRLKSQLTGKCTPRKLAKVVDEAGNESTPCLIVDAQFAPAKDPTGALIQPDQTSVSACRVCADRPGREVLSKEIEGLLRRNDDVSQFQCLCGVTQFKGADLTACASGSESVGQTGEKQGWCYIDNSAAGESDQNPLTKSCPSHTTIRLATDTNKSTFFITCLGAGLTTETPTAGAAGASQLAARKRARPSVSPSGAERRVFSFEGARRFAFHGERPASPGAREIRLIPGGTRRGIDAETDPMSTKKTILMIEDEPHIVLGVRDALEFEGFRFLHADRGKDGVALAKQETPDAVLLDLMLPDMNGYQVCQELRRWDAFVPILMLTARSQETDKIRGLDAGADDYVTKPFGIGELIARIRALFRRANRVAEPSRETFLVGPAAIDLAAHTLSRDGEKHQLSFYEVELLRLLFERAGQPVSRDEILSKVWGLEATPSNRTVDNFIVKLRKKVEPSADKPEHILTVYGYGYKLVP